MILTNVVNVLLAEPDKVFNWSDMAFFHKWWNEQNEEKQNDVRKLIKDKRFVFIGGGWVMNDEALPSYKESMLQMRLGLDFLRDTFGVRPNIGWQIDPFGSSALTVSVLNKLGYDALVENRISQNFKTKLSDKDGYNFYWEGHQVSKNKEDTNLFTHIIQRHYNLPQYWSDSNFLFKNMQSYRSTVFRLEIDPTMAAIDHLNKEEKKNTYHTMLHAGDDFTFQEADKVFHQFDSLITELHNVSRMSLQCISFQCVIYFDLGRINSEY